MTWRVNFVRSKAAQKQLARTSLTWNFTHPGLKLASYVIIVIVLYFTVDDRIIARWTNNLYYAGKVCSIGNGLVNVLFDDNDRIIHRVSDISAVIPDRVPHDVAIGHHVVATWKGGNKYYIGYVSDRVSDDRFKVTFDDNDEDYYAVSQLRIFPDHWQAYEGQYKNHVHDSHYKTRVSARGRGRGTPRKIW